MTAEEVFSALYDKYGVDFNWHLLPLLQANGNFVEELKREIGNDHFLYYRKVLAEIKLCKLMILPKEGIENRR